MPEHLFHALTRCIAKAVPFNVASNYCTEDAMKLHQRRIEDAGTLGADADRTVVSSNVWGWKVLIPFRDSASAKSGYVVAEALETLAEAIRVCEFFECKFTVRDVEDPDPV